MKTYVLMVSRYFPKGHSREGQPTEFVYKIENGIGVYNHLGGEDKKIHTIRANYDLWAKRFEEINAGEACLSLRYWEGKPYRSKQIEFARLTKDDGIGLEMLEDWGEQFMISMRETEGHINWTCCCWRNKETVAYNDGLTLNDWEEWFKGCYLSKPMAIIHFTNFRY